MALYNYEYVDGKYQEIGEDEIDNIQNQQTRKTQTVDSFVNKFMPSSNQYTYKSASSAYDVTSLVEKEYLEETKSLSDKYGSELSSINVDYDTSKANLDSEREKELQNEYIKKEKKLDILPSNLAQTGLDGGANETGNMQIESDYQGARNNIEDYFLSELNKLIAARDEQLRKEQEEYDRMMQSAASSYQSEIEKAQSSVKNQGSYVSAPNYSLNIKTENEEDDEKSPYLPNIFNYLGR